MNLQKYTKYLQDLLVKSGSASVFTLAHVKEAQVAMASSFKISTSVLPTGFFYPYSYRVVTPDWTANAMLALIRQLSTAATILDTIWN
ncbi:hypothetical protein PVK06_035782 [Gossypium arboreum]|uniref:Uncharacterized protein n=1 Tax=Gossypium arboreum TaxID=29729 RepID=A0ABR0NHR9_GOSAR|nr:hypothetical protein PVK06_035782 [Gossypium arboreum]